MRGRLLAAGAALACALAAAACVALALDVLAVRAALARDDVRYRALPERRLWAPRELLPGAARLLLGVEDDLRFRRALRAVRLSHPELPGYTDPSFVLHRNEASALLQEILQRDRDARRRSAAATLLGVFSFSEAIADFQNRARLLEGAAGRFRQAIALDPGNEEAKMNLELALSRARGLELAEAGGGTNPSPGGKGAKGAGAGEPGGGY